MNNQVKQYINTASATFLALVMIVKGAAAGFFLYQIVYVIANLVKVFNGSEAYIRELTDSMPSYVEGISVEALFGMISASGRVIIIFLSLAAIWVIIGLMDTIAVVFLRFAKVGANIVKIIHLIYMIICIIEIVLLGYAAVSYIIHPSLIDYQELGIPTSGINIVLIIAAVLYLVLLILRMCFHKDIVRAMSTVNYEIKARRPGPLKKTHLSGISFIYGIIYAIITVVMIVILLTQNTSNAIVIYAVVMAVTTIEYFSIVFCNRNLKNAR